VSNDKPPPSQDDFDELEDLFENAPCGYVSTSPNGRITRVNKTLAGWLEADIEQFVGRRFSDLLTIGGKLFYETHLAPTLRMQESISEIAVDLNSPNGAKLPVIINAVERRGDNGEPRSVRITIFRAIERRQYERNILSAKQAAEVAVREERDTAQLREQFIAVLGHDLRNPIAAIQSGVRLLEKEPVSERGRQVLGLMDGSVRRASALIDNVLDFARSRLGAGIALTIERDLPLAPVIEQVVAELRSVTPGRTIEATILVDEPVAADHGRIGQLISNLLGNAITHGAPEEPVHVRAAIREGTFELSVSNGGAEIPEETMAHLFQPFFRGAVRPSQQGLGLGLHIASEIAKAHAGELKVTSTPEETRFTFTMPHTVHQKA
jgi:sigma-B regulation protein RsbU (phosphoserine phosphatase)